MVVDSRRIACLAACVPALTATRVGGIHQVVEPTVRKKWGVALWLRQLPCPDSVVGNYFSY